MNHGVTRRQVLRWGVAGATALMLPAVGLPGCGDEDHFTSGFLTPEEKDVLSALVARVVPADDTIGALDAGAITYIDRLLASVPSDADPRGVVFAGGPFSGRNPFPDDSSGTPSTHFPPNDFARFLPLTRLQRMSWRIRLLGSAAVPGADFNAEVVGPVIGWRDQYRAGLAAIQAQSRALFQADFTALTPEQQEAVLGAADPDFLDLVFDHTVEGMFSAPEYGGNTQGRGWALIRYGGDSQPLGYSIFDASAKEYRSRADKPSDTANPDEDMSGVGPATDRFLRVLVRSVGEAHFPL